MCVEGGGQREGESSGPMGEVGFEERGLVDEMRDRGGGQVLLQPLPAEVTMTTFK